MRLRFPLDKEWVTRLVQGVEDTDLPPEELLAIWLLSMAFNGCSIKFLLDRSQIIDSNYPGKPPATSFRFLGDQLTKGCLVGRRVVESANYFDIARVSQWKDEIPGPELWVDATVNKRGTELTSNSLDNIDEAVVGGRVGDMVQMHGGILPQTPSRLDQSLGFEK